MSGLRVKSLIQKRLFILGIVLGVVFVVPLAVLGYSETYTITDTNSDSWEYAGTSSLNPTSTSWIAGEAGDDTAIGTDDEDIVIRV